MIKKLTKHGNSLALVIDQRMLDLLEIDAETLLNIKADDKCLIVRPIHDAARKKKFHAALEEGKPPVWKDTEKAGLAHGRAAAPFSGRYFRDPCGSD